MTQGSPDNALRLPESPTFWKLALVAVAFVWGFSFTVMKDTLALVSPMWLIAIRFVPATLVMAVPVLPRLRSREAAPALLAGVALGVFLWASYALEVWGLGETTASKGSFLCGVHCVEVPFAVWVLSGVRPRRRAFAAAVLCVAGLALISLNADLSVGLGDLACVAGATCIAVEEALVPRLGEGRDMALVSVGMYAITSVLSLAWALVADPVPGADAFSPTALWTWAFLSLVCTCLAIWVNNEALLHVHPAPAALLVSLESPFGAVIAVTVAGDLLTGRLVAGFALIALAVVVSEAGDLLLAWAERLLPGREVA